jgi:hypothetical protein
MDTELEPALSTMPIIRESTHGGTKPEHTHTYWFYDLESGVTLTRLECPMTSWSAEPRAAGIAEYEISEEEVDRFESKASNFDFWDGPKGTPTVRITKAT